MAPTRTASDAGFCVVAGSGFAVFGLFLLRDAWQCRRRIERIRRDGHAALGTVVGSEPESTGDDSERRTLVRWVGEGGDVCLLPLCWGGHWLSVGQTVRVRGLPNARSEFVVEECVPHRSVRLLGQTIIGVGLALAGGLVASTAGWHLVRR